MSLVDNASEGVDISLPELALFELVPFRLAGLAGLQAVVSGHEDLWGAPMSRASVHPSSVCAKKPLD